MNVFAASDLEAADLLALGRLDDDGAPRMIAAAPGRARRQLTPALMGVG